MEEMSTDSDPPQRYSDPGERISLTDLEEIKPLDTTPPPVPNEAAEHFDLDEAMTRALSSVAAPPPPSIEVDAPAEKKPSSSRNLRPLQAVAALLAGAAIAWFVQGSPTPSGESTTTPAPQTTTEIAQAETTEVDPPAIPEMEAMVQEETMSVPAETETELSEVAAIMPPPPSDPVVAQRPDDEESEEAGSEPAHGQREPETDVDEPETDEGSNPHLPPDYHTPEAEAAREAHREEVQQAQEAAEAAAAAAAEAEAARAELPPHPDRDAVRESMEAVRSAITECAGGQHGTARLRITVHHSGRVQGAQVEGTFAGSSEGSCMALAARRARFPAFSEDRFSITYPFTF
jgi:hypothetical protein